jgi:putative transposase
MTEYRHSAHAVFDLKYHIIWCTKYRYKILRGRVAERARDLIRQICQAHWGQHMWARGYFCATVGAVDEATIKAYIENQKWDEDDEGFKITAPTEP